ncbi:MAG: alkaline phosphatase family protein [Candidatus Bipolaricaulia bacterium]
MLRELVDRGEARLPDWNRSLVNLLATVLRLFGQEPPHPPLPEELLPDLRGIRKVVLLVIDALGWEGLQPLLEDKRLIFSRLADEKRGPFPLTSVFPATTAAALASLATGLAPAEHGLLGFRLFLREFGLVANMLSLSPEGFKRPDGLFELGLKPGRFFPVKTVFERLAPEVKSFVLLKLAFHKSGLSRLLYRGAPVRPIINSSDLCVQMRKLLEQGGEGPLFICAYWDALDGIGHLYGPSKEELQAELRQLSFSLEHEFFDKLSSQAARDALLLITADHGLVEVRKEEMFSITGHPRLRRGLLLPPTGDFRATYLHLRQGERGPIKRYLKRYSDRLTVIDSEEALAAGLFGPSKAISDEWRPRLGDLILLARGRGFIFYPYDDFILKGYHGGLAPEEMRVPLFALRLG